LLLASALAASACTIKEKDDPKGSGGQSSGGNGGSPGSGGSGDGGTEAGAGGSGGAAEAGSPDAGVPDSSVGPEAGPEGGAPDGGDAAACNDDTGEPGDCAVVSSAESCGLYDFQAGNCDSASLYMKPGIAAKFVACIVGQSQAELCDAMNTYGCKDAALKTACPDPTVDSLCNEIVVMCPDDATLTDCRTYLSGLNTAGRDSMYSCMESGCYGLYSCAEGL
jgi:hypothetical protein